MYVRCNDSENNVQYPICPFSIYFEGDEDKCNASECDFDLITRSCTKNCKKYLKLFTKTKQVLKGKQMNLTLDETWKYCLEMWKWISEEKTVFVDNDVVELKSTWLRNHNFLSYLKDNCFFCDWAHDYSVKSCLDCPGKLVDKNFMCMNDEYHYREKPTKFYQKLVELNNIRLKKEKQMNEQEIDQKLEAYYKDIASIETNIAELKKQKVALQKKWIAIVNYYSNGEPARLILNLKKLDKEFLKKALDCGENWVSFCNNGNEGTCESSDALTFYAGETKIIFGEDNGE